MWYIVYELRNFPKGTNKGYLKEKKGGREGLFKIDGRISYTLLHYTFRKYPVNYLFVSIALIKKKAFIEGVNFFFKNQTSQAPAMSLSIWHTAMSLLRTLSRCKSMGTSLSLTDMLCLSVWLALGVNKQWKVENMHVDCSLILDHFPKLSQHKIMI